MKPILQHLVEMTGHRDHLRLEVSVLSTLQKLSGIKEVRALELFTDDSQPHIRPRTWVQDGQLVSTGRVRGSSSRPAVEGELRARDLVVAGITVQSRRRTYCERALTMRRR